MGKSEPFLSIRQAGAAPTAALMRAAELLAADPSAAEGGLRAILRDYPSDPNAIVLLARSLRAQQKFKPAVLLLKQLVGGRPDLAAAQYELALAYMELGKRDRAVRHLREAVRLDPALPNAWLALADLLWETGEKAQADCAYCEHAKISEIAPYIRSALAAIERGDAEGGAALLLEHLKRVPSDIAAAAVLAEILSTVGNYGEAAILLLACLERAPSFAAARLLYATMLSQLQRPREMLIEADTLLRLDGQDIRYRMLHAMALAQCGKTDVAIAEYEAVLGDHPRENRARIEYGHVLRAAGEGARALDAYRHALALDPACGEAYWAIANLKTARFAPDEIARMRACLACGDLSEREYVYVHFSLGKALEDEGDYEQSFNHYATGNALRRAQIRYDPNAFDEHVVRSRAAFTASLFSKRKTAADRSPGPIFIVGLPRAGSTLVEQILDSHSAVEGLGELPEIRALARRVERGAGELCFYPEIVSKFGDSELRALGEEYLSRTRALRLNAKPCFTDKMPANFEHIGLIALILPEAKIIDVRRHPLACCLSNFKQLYAQGQLFSYSLEELGRYYAGYIALMAHFDAVLPGRIHRVHYEALVRDPEAEIAGMLEYCGLPFEPGCLRFHENLRAAHTISSEQVRRPLSSAGIESWRHFEPWLGPLRETLGSTGS